MPSIERLRLELTAEIAEELSGAYVAGRPIVVAYVDEEGYPRMSYRGSTQVFGPQQLALWARKPDGGLPRAIVARPRVSLIYRNAETRQTYVFYGRASISTDEKARILVYDRSPKSDQDADPNRAGAALVVDLERVEAMGPQRFYMER